MSVEVESQIAETSELEDKQVDLGLQKQNDTEVKDEEAEESAAVEQQTADGDDSNLAKPSVSDHTDDASDARQTSSKIFRAIDHWMRFKDLQQALLRNSALTDIAFSTLSQMLHGCPSLHTLDLSCNQLTMDSCSDICQLITTAKNLNYVSVESNAFSLRSLGYFMTAIMERQSDTDLTALDLFDFQNNEGLSVAKGENRVGPDMLVTYPELRKYATPMMNTLFAVATALWMFMYDTGHPQVKECAAHTLAFQELDSNTMRKIRTALSKILLLDENAEGSEKKTKSFNADLAILFPSEQSIQARTNEKGEKTVQLPAISKGEDKSSAFDPLRPKVEKRKDKCMTFNLKQILTKNGAILMNMLERLLETTSVNARDVETQQSLLEYACYYGNLGLAKLCYRRGGNLNEQTISGSTPFNIAVEYRRYDLMEFLHMYGVKVNSADAEGQTGLHVATSKNDIDAICRLIEWGADVNLRDHKKRTPLHMAAIGGHEKVAMLLLELGADINAKDEREFTAVAHAEANDKFKLMDRLIFLGGLGHGLQKAKSVGALPDTMKLRTSLNKSMGALPVSVGLRKRTCLGRLGKYR